MRFTTVPGLVLCTLLPSIALADDAAATTASTPTTPTTLAAEPIDDDALQAALRKREGEPPVQDVVDAAVAAARTNPRRFDAMLSRARLRGLIPSLELGARRGQGIDLRPTTTDGVDGVRLSTADDLTLTAALRFELGRLLFAGEETAIAREQRAEAARSAELVRGVVELYFRRKRLLLERDLHAHNDIDHEVRIAEAEALLDGFTAGAFRRMMAARSTAWTTGANTDVSKQP